MRIDIRFAKDKPLDIKIVDNKVAVDANYFWQEMDTCPQGVKVQLLNAGSVAIYGTYDGKYSYWLGWAPLPKRKK